MSKQNIRHDVAFVIPVYNEGRVVGDVIREVQKQYSVVVAVNDGSRDDSAEVVAATGAYLINHPINMGQGAALQTGIEFARGLKDIKYFVTFDSDGQHRLEDVDLMLKTIESEELDIILGSRFLGSAVNMPTSKKLLFGSAIWFSNVTSGLKLTDTHNGLRVFNRHVAETMQITMADYAHASEILAIIKTQNYRYKEVPVQIIYSDYSLNQKKGQSVINAINIGFDVLMARFSK